MNVSKTTFTPNPEYAQKLKGEKDERDCRLALDVLKVAVDASPGKTAGEIAQTAETFWQWVIND